MPVKKATTKKTATSRAKKTVKKKTAKKATKRAVKNIISKSSADQQDISEACEDLVHFEDLASIVEQQEVHKKNIDSQEKAIESIQKQMKNPVKKSHLEGKLLWIKLGDDNNPASAEEIQAMTEKVEALMKYHKVNCMSLITHHSAEINVIE